MDNKELRIGNFLKGGEVWDIGIADVVFVNKPHGRRYGYIHQNCKPIRLTEEWLLKFGFVYLRGKLGTQGVYSNSKVNVVLSNSGNVYTMRNKAIRYVHIFQNWYYYNLLTGEELTTK